MSEDIKISGLKKAVGDNKRANADGAYSPRYGYMMLDRNTGEVWTDEFYSLGRNSWKEYHDPAIINLISFISERVQEDFHVTMETVKEYAHKAIAEYRKSS